MVGFTERKEKGFISLEVKTTIEFRKFANKEKIKNERESKINDLNFLFRRVLTL